MVFPIIFALTKNVISYLLSHCVPFLLNRPGEVVKDGVVCVPDFTAKVNSPTVVAVELVPPEGNVCDDINKLFAIEAGIDPPAPP